MRSPADMSVIQIDVTNRCHLSCANCTRFVNHVRKPFVMNLADIERAIRSLDGYSGNIGLMGGEPALHPDFLDILRLYRELIPKSRRQLWTAGYKWEEYEEEIHRTFYDRNIAYNDHSKPFAGVHQPLMVSISEVLEDDEERIAGFIENCWVQNRWSASITPKGAFFCEVAAAKAHLLDDDFGIPLTKNWWQIKPDNGLFRRQIDAYCRSCSGCLPMIGRYTSHSPYDVVSEGNIRKFNLDHKRVITADLDVVRAYLHDKSTDPGAEPGSLKDFPEWKPWNYRTEVFHAPGEGTLSPSQVRKLQRNGK